MCKTVDGKDVNYSLKTDLYCSKVDKNGSNAPELVEAVYDDCVYTTTIKHLSGCQTANIDIDSTVDWLSDNMWCIGIMYLIAGPLIALFGTAWFPIVTASLIAIFIIGVITSFSLSMGWMATTGGTVAVMVIALVLGVIAGMLVRRKIWIMVSLLGLIAGFFTGSLIFAMIYGSCGWDAVWGYWVISCTIAIIGLMASFKLGKPVVMTGTSMVGSYLFMRSWTLFFPGHYPSEAEIVDDYDQLEADALFWVFIGVFISCFVGSLIFQCKYDKSNDELDEAFKSQE